MGIHWEDHMQDVHRLYIQGSKTAEETVEFLNTKPGTKITVRQFKFKFGGMKKIQKVEWQTIAQRISALEAEGKKWDVYLHGRHVPESRVRRAIKRYPFNRGPSNASANAHHLGPKSYVEVRSKDTAEGTSEVDLMASSTSHTGDASDNQPMDHFTIPNPTTSGLGSLGAVEGASTDQGYGLDLPIDFLNETLTGDRTLPNINTDFDSLLENGELSGGLDYLWPTSSQNEINLSLSRPQALPQSPLRGMTPMDCISNDVSTFDNFDFYVNHFSPVSSRSPVTSSENLKFTSFWQSKAVRKLFPQLQIFDIVSTSPTSPLELQSNFNKGILSILVSIHPALIVLKDLAQILDHLTSPQTFLQPDALAMYLHGTEGKNHMIQAWFTMAHLVINRLVDNEQVCEFMENLISGVYQIDLSVFWTTSSAIIHGQALICRILESYCGYVRKNYRHEGMLFLRSYPKEHYELLSKANKRSLSGALGLELLRVAIRQNHLEAVEFLLNQGVKISKTSGPDTHETDSSPLELAIEEGSEDVIRMILRLEPNIKEARVLKKGERSLLGRALSKRRVEACRALLEARVPVTPGQMLRLRSLSPELYQTSRENADRKARDICDIIEAAEGGLGYLSELLLDHDDFRSDEILEEALYVSIEQYRQTATRNLLRSGVDANLNKYLKRGDGGLGNAKCPQTEDEGHLHPNCKGTSLLILAIQADADAHQSVYLLAKSGAVLDATEWQQLIPYGRVKPDSWIILHGAGYNVAAFGADALQMWSGPDDGILLLLQLFLGAGMSVDACSQNGWSILQIMARKQKLCGVQYLLDQGAKVNQPAAEKGGRTALQAAAGNANEEMIELLLDAGADITAPPAKEQGLTVLEAVAIGYPNEEQTRLFEKLLKKGAPINRPNGRLLHYLIDRSNLELLAVALRAGARIEDRFCAAEIRTTTYPTALSNALCTPLQLAAYLGNEDAIKLLVKHGADTNAVASGHEGATALQAAILSVHFVKHALYVREPNHPRLHRIVSFLLDAHADSNAPPSSDFGRTALQAAASLDPPSLHLVQLLINRGADVNAKPAAKGGITALQGAAIAGRMQVVLLLLNHHADVNADAAPEDGRTAIEGAAEHGRLETVRLLLTKAQFPLPDGFKKAIGLAKDNGHWAIVDLLENAQNCFNPCTLSYDENVII